MTALRDRPLRDAIAAVTCWLDDDRHVGTRIAASAVDHDPVAFLDALGGLMMVLNDVCATEQVDLTAIVRDVALGVAQAEAEAGDGPGPPTGPGGHPDAGGAA